MSDKVQQALEEAEAMRIALGALIAETSTLAKYPAMFFSNVRLQLTHEETRAKKAQQFHTANAFSHISAMADIAFERLQNSGRVPREDLNPPT